MCDNVVDQFALMVSCRFHREFSGFLKLTGGCTKMDPKMDPFFNSIHPVLGFSCILELPHPANNHVGNVCRLDMGVRRSGQFPVF